MNKAPIPCLNLGVCDYPEHVGSDQWQLHAQQQQALGLNFIRIGEFSWQKIEPHAGQFDWQWLDDAIDIYQQHGLNVVLGTPTATPPAWLIEAHPEILAVDENNQVKKFGSRRHYDHGSVIYRQECQRIVRAMAERYGNHPAVVGWQTDNELGHEGTAQSYSASSVAGFQQWLKARYTNLEALNEAWGTVFWSQTYSSWTQISSPNLSAVRQANPSQVLDFKRYCSDMIIAFQQLQIDILRDLSPGRFITHNFVIFASEFDLYKASKNLDFVAWDSYPIGMLEYFATWESEEVKTRYARTGHPDLVSLNHDIYRGLKNGTDFWVMEQQCGHANWAQYNPLPAQGAVQLWTAQAWAHGAQSVIYFRWRASHMAQEIMHSGLLQQDGRADRGYQEVANVEPTQYPLSPVKAKIAFLHDFESMWIYDQQPHNANLSYWAQFYQFYSVARSLGLDVDIISPLDLENNAYSLVIAPALTLVTDEVARLLVETAKDTKILFGPRTAFRTESGLVPQNGQFSAIADLVGIKLANFDSLRPTLSQSLEASDADFNVSFTATLWCESYEVGKAKALFKYSDGPMAGLAAVTILDNVTVIGALSENLIKTVIRQQCAELAIGTTELADGIRLSRRGEKTLLQNFNQNEVSFEGQQVPAVSSVFR
ncbi:beta-galactosidase [Flavobacterium sp. W21_SRS_FM6]|uniref:beta-galactosidase n=1 Tax=Flavobacterium sp. W21_SRS_FM6 TaxID=3240268 RepID=UPI003F918138